MPEMNTVVKPGEIIVVLVAAAVAWHGMIYFAHPLTSYPTLNTKEAHFT